MTTVVAHLTEASRLLEAERKNQSGPDAAREFSIAITAVEDAIMRTNRGMAMREGRFHVADVELSANEEAALLAGQIPGQTTVAEMVGDKAPDYFPPMPEREDLDAEPGAA